MRNGKIATLPANIRDELNLRLDQGEDGPALLDWLNSLPEVQARLAENFDAVPLTKQNLSQWRLGGFRQWQLRRDLEVHAYDLADTARDLHENLDLLALPGQLAATLATRFAALLNTWDGEPDPKLTDQLRLLHALNRDIALLQKTVHQSAQQLRQRDQQQADDLQRDIEAAKKKVLNPILAAQMHGPLAEEFGGGPFGENLASLITALKYDLPIPKVDLTPTPPPTKAASHRSEEKSPSQNAFRRPPLPTPKTPPSHPRLPR